LGEEVGEGLRSLRGLGSREWGRGEGDYRSTATKEGRICISIKSEVDGRRSERLLTDDRNDLRTTAEPSGR